MQHKTNVPLHIIHNLILIPILYDYKGIPIKF